MTSVGNCLAGRLRNASGGVRERKTCRNPCMRLREAREDQIPPGPCARRLMNIGRIRRGSSPPRFTLGPSDECVLCLGSSGPPAAREVGPVGYRNVPPVRRSWSNVRGNKHMPSGDNRGRRESLLQVDLCAVVDVHPQRCAVGSPSHLTGNVVSDRLARD